MEGLVGEIAYASVIAQLRFADNCVLYTSSLILGAVALEV